MDIGDLAPWQSDEQMQALIRHENSRTHDNSRTLPHAPLEKKSSLYDKRHDLYTD